MVQPVFVLGMHRSGTSALMGVISQLGLTMGSGIAPGGPGNVKGYFERFDIMILHERVLQAIGMNWHDAFPFPEDWWKDPKIADFREEIKAVLVREFENAPIWCLKDPRMCRMLPLWLDILEELQWRPSFVLTTRNPVEVAGSLQKRNEFPTEKTLTSWLAHTLDAERYTRNHPRVFVSFQRLLEDWRREMARISQALDITWPVAPETAGEGIDGFLSPTLKHFSGDEAELSSWPMIQDAYAAFNKAIEGDDTEVGDAFDRVSETFDHFNRLFEPIYRNAKHINEKGHMDLALLEKLAKQFGGGS